MLPERNGEENFDNRKLLCVGVLRNYSTVIGFSCSDAISSSPIDSNLVDCLTPSAAAPRKLPEGKHTTFNYAIKSFLERSSEKLMERKNCCKCVEDFFTLRRRPHTTGNWSLPRPSWQFIARLSLEAAPRQATPTCKVFTYCINGARVLSLLL